MGSVDPGMAYYRALTDGEEEARLMKAQQDAVRNSRGGHG